MKINCSSVALLIFFTSTFVSSGQNNNNINNKGSVARSISSSAAAAIWADEIEKRPYFLPAAKVVTVQEGGHAFFICKVENLYNQTVSWIRSRDSHILFIGDVKFVDDDRFDLLPGNGYGDWSIRFRFIREADAGSYECQISTSPKLSQTFELKVVIPSVRISDDKELHVKSGSSLELKCTVYNYITRPTYINWYHNNNRLISDFTPGVTIKDTIVHDRKEDFQPIHSILTVQEASEKLSGKYSCVPDNLRPTSIKVHVILDENPAAMQREISSNRATFLPSINLYLLMSSIFSLLVLRMS